MMNFIIIFIVSKIQARELKWEVQRQDLTFVNKWQYINDVFVDIGFLKL